VLAEKLPLPQRLLVDGNADTIRAIAQGRADALVENVDFFIGFTKNYPDVRWRVLPEPIFTPSTKAAVGDHDENIGFDRVVELIGGELAEAVRAATLKIYRHAAAYAAERGILIADTKLEFGLDENGQLIVMDEMLTPDSSRFWPADQYQVGISPPSYDKQFVRDYLETLDWNKTAPGPKVPAAVIEATRAKYAEALLKLTGIVA
jgi:phosphoribosylaminoimidazole-succinocarboxamide synthase